MEEFKRCLPDRLVTHLNEQKTPTLVKAAMFQTSTHWLTRCCLVMLLKSLKPITSYRGLWKHPALLILENGPEKKGTDKWKTKRVPLTETKPTVNAIKHSLMQQETRYLLQHGLAKPSSSTWCSPCLLRGKPNGSYRFITNYWKVNDDRFLQYTVMAFGMCNAPATLQPLIHVIFLALFPAQCSYFSNFPCPYHPQHSRLYSLWLFSPVFSCQCITACGCSLLPQGGIFFFLRLKTMITLINRHVSSETNLEDKCSLISKTKKKKSLI